MPPRSTSFCTTRPYMAPFTVSRSLIQGCARLGLTFAVVSMVFGQSAEPVKQEDLVAHYERYSGSQLVVSGQVISGPEMTVMICRACRWIRPGAKECSSRCRRR